MEMRVGEAMAGRGENRVHINLLLGSRAGPVGHAFATALASPRPSARKRGRQRAVPG
jgi:5,6,7,8-tetrahydromethanopterin hydro-lyase